MVYQIEIKRFKSIEKAKLQLGKLNIFIGTNASGKSNLFEAFKFLQGIGFGFTIDEILNGKAKSSSSIEWDGLRGGNENIVFKQTKNISSFDIDMELDTDRSPSAYHLEVEPLKNRIVGEFLIDAGLTVFNTGTKKAKGLTHTVEIKTGKTGRSPVYNLNEHNSSLQQVLDLSATDEKRENLIKFFISFLSDQQRLDIVPSVLRGYSKQSSATRIGEKGENFASVVKNIIADPKSGKEYLNWLRKLTPNEIDEIEIGKGAVNDLIFGIKENGHIIYAPSLSDGTLRFAAITAALFQPSPPKMLLVEEIENGIHPTRMRLLMELLMSRAENGGSQLFITTHSPVLLDWIRERYFSTVFFCARGENGATAITPVSEIPDFKETIKKSSLSELFTEGWLETTV
jgi:predicted ATPase